MKTEQETRDFYGYPIDVKWTIYEADDETSLRESFPYNDVDLFECLITLKFKYFTFHVNEVKELSFIVERNEQKEKIFKCACKSLLKIITNYADEKEILRANEDYEIAIKKANEKLKKVVKQHDVAKQFLQSIKDKQNDK